MKMYGQFLHDSAALLERIRYKMQRRKRMVVFADVNATLGARSDREQLPEENAKTEIIDRIGRLLAHGVENLRSRISSEHG